MKKRVLTVDIEAILMKSRFSDRGVSIFESGGDIVNIIERVGADVNNIANTQLLSRFRSERK